MASDVKNLTTLYANLPSIFESDPLTSPVEPSFGASNTLVNNEKTYQSMFGSFLFAESEPLTRAAFVASTSPPIDVEKTEERLMGDDLTLRTKPDISSSNSDIQTKPTPPLAPIEDMSDMDDEDDFDGIPVRNTSTMLNKKLNGDNDTIINHSEHNNLFNEIVHCVENDYQNNDNHHIDNEDDDDIDSFLNGFINDEQHDKMTGPALFKDIPDIDDLNAYEEEEEDDDRIPFDHMDMLDQSDSIRSSSPDSLLSSSHLRDEHDDEEEEMNNNDDEDEDVTQWNDDFILSKPIIQNDRPNAPLPPVVLLNLHPHDQVDFIDSSRSHSRCSNTSSHLSNGYADQERIFIDDDGLVTSSDSDDDDDNNEHNDKINFEYDTLDRHSSEEPCLQVNLDHHRSRSSSNGSLNKSISTRSSSPIPDESPIVAIDEDINEMKPIQAAPMALVDDDDDDEGDDELQTFGSDQPVLPMIPSKSFIELKTEKKQNEIVQDIIEMRHAFNEYDNDDEFIAIMHNPTVFEETLYDDDDDQQKLDFIKQDDVVLSTLQMPSQLSFDNKIENESLKQYQNIQQTSSSISDKIENSNSPSSILSNTTTTITNNRSPTAVNHLTITNEEEEEEKDGPIDTSSIKQEKEKQPQQSEKKNTTNITIKQITNGKDPQHYKMMSSDDESDNDSELLNTLSQLHGIIHTPRVSYEKHQNEFLCQNINEIEILNKKIQENEEDKSIENLLLPSDIIDGKKHFDETEKISFENKSSTFFSLTSLTSSALFNDDESYSTDVILDSDASPSLIMSTNELNNSMPVSNQLTIDDLQITNTHNDDLLLQITTNQFDPFTRTMMTTESNYSNLDDLWNQSMSNIVPLNNKEEDKNDLSDYLHWIIDHLNDDLQSSTIVNSIQNLQGIRKDIHTNDTITNGIHYDLLTKDECEHTNIVQEKENKNFSSFDSEVAPIVEKLVSNTLRLALADVNNESHKQIEQLVDRILCDAIYEIYYEDNTSSVSKLDDNLPTENLASIVNWHNQLNLPNKQLLDPFDQKFDSIWTSHFEAPDDISNQSLFEYENKTDINPWLIKPIISNVNINPSSFHSNTLNPTNNIPETESSPLLINPFDFTITDNDLMKYSLTESVINDSSSFPDYLTLYKNELSGTTDQKVNEETTESNDLSTTENQDVFEEPLKAVVKDSDDDDDDDDDVKQDGNVFTNQSRLSQFEAFASDQPLNTLGIESITADIDNEFDESTNDNAPWASTTSIEQQSENVKSGDDEPWELDESGEDKKASTTAAVKKNDSYNNFFSDTQSSSSAAALPPPRLSTVELSDDEKNNEESDEDNYDAYFSKNQPSQDTEQPSSKSVRFDDVQKVAVLTPKDSLDRSESSATSDSDDIEDEEVTPSFLTVSDRITDHLNEEYTDNEERVEIAVRNLPPRPESNISLTESEDLPPPLPPLPPLNKKSTISSDNIPLKSSLASSSSNTDLKRKTNLQTEAEITPTIQTTTDANLYNNTDTQFVRSFDSAILRSTSKDDAGVDPEEINDVISCMIDNNQVNIDAKTISPFKCVLGSAGQLPEDSQTAVVAIYGCWLPDRRLREYRYIMDQLFYYVYHKLEKMVINDYVLIYFHGATPKHRTPDLNILRKCYQMINFRLRKNLRAVYVVHPTRWLRTVIALSRPFFSNKFYNKVHYLYTIAELERQFPHNHLSIPVVIEQFDETYRAE